MALYIQSDELRSIAQRLKNKFPHNLADANLDRIVFLMELESPSKTKLAVTKKVDAALKTVYDETDYLIIFFQKRWDNLNTAQRNILVMHELMHCELSGEKMRKHDVEDFYELAVKFGVDWAENENVKDPLAEDFNDVLIPKPVLIPDKYTDIMEEDHGIFSNVSSQYHPEEE